MDKLQSNVNDRDVERTAIGRIMRVVDPETGKKFTELDLVAHGSTFMYKLWSQLSLISAPLDRIQQLHV